MTDQITILGATGSIGRDTLDVISRHQKRFQVWGLSAQSRVKKLAGIAVESGAKVVSIGEGRAKEFRSALNGQKNDIRVVEGEAGLKCLAEMPESEVVVTGIVGAAGLLPTLSAIRAGKKVLIANKEPLVMMGSEMMHEAVLSGATVIPLDSEHNAALQCLPRSFRSTPPIASKSLSTNRFEEFGIVKVILTASGGPFLDVPIAELANVTPEQAAAHPKWNMGKKISIDSATMMNKGLELIEACALFTIEPKQVEIVVHPQSIVHSLVEYRDGSLLAQMASPDMRIPIVNALGYPDRISSGSERLDVAQLGVLEFREPDEQSFPCLRLAREVAETGGTAPVTLNAANEIAVEAFCEGRIRFTQISEFVDRTLQLIPVLIRRDLETVLEADIEARRVTKDLIMRRPVAA
jgi:1-deoxy-D-xylulose-5-phosphate reductoisomerase